MANFCCRADEIDSPINVKLTVGECKNLIKTDTDAVNKVLQSTAEKAFYRGRKDAQKEFDKNFTTLLTIITIFGIAWPVIVQMLQLKFSEKELKSRIE